MRERFWRWLGYTVFPSLGIMIFGAFGEMFCHAKICLADGIITGQPLVQTVFDTGLLGIFFGGILFQIRRDFFKKSDVKVSE
jgi:hypothetical protein